MTTYIPALTLPSAIFAHPASSILLPVALGTAVGFAVSRKSSPHNLSFHTYQNSNLPTYLHT